MGIDVEAAIAALTLEQKVSLLAGVDSWHTAELPGVPPMRCSDGPAGVRGTSWSGPGSASFPCGTSLGASFDPGLVEEIGDALGQEALAKGANVLLAPTVNLHRTPIGGRNFECMSEDPVLTAHIAVGYVKGLQARGVAACIKHFVANDTEFERMTISSEVDDRTLREMYLVPFEAAVRPIDEGGADVKSIMTSYNRINGTYASENAPIIRTILRDEWGWTGALISDWFGTHSAAESLEAGLDLEMPGPPRQRGDALLAAVRAGEVSEARVDESVRRLLQLFRWSGVGEIDTTETTPNDPNTRALIRRAAIGGSVLLRNEDGALPLASSARIALIGPNAEAGQIQGGGSARVRPSHPSKLLNVLRSRGVDVTFAEGCNIAKRLPPLRGDFTVNFTGADGATAQQSVDRLNFLWQDEPAEGIARETFAVDITGTFTPTETGDWTFGLTAVGPATLTVNGDVVASIGQAETGGAYFGMGSHEHRATVALEEGVTCEVRLQSPGGTDAMLRGLLVGARAPEPADPIGEAAALAAAADVAVVVVGTDLDWETEGEDRTSMDLPGAQDELIARVVAANPNTIVVINAGSPVSTPWRNDVAAIMQVWFPGEDIGEAIADMLLGVSEPSGRLPITIPDRLADTPAFEHHPGKDGKAIYAEKQFIGYRWYQREGIVPAYPFGHGLSYTTFTVDGATVEGDITSGVTVRATVRNTGQRSGTHVVQCYVQAPDGDPDRPARTLRGFAKVTVEAGASADVAIWLPERAFSVWDVAAHGWVVPAGEYQLLLGASSADVTLVGAVSS